MRGLQNVFQMAGRSIFLVLFLFGFLGSECARVGGGDSPPDTEKVLSEQEARTEAAKKAAEEARKRAEEARQAEDAVKAAEEERKQKEAEAEVEKQQQIQTALRSAASSVLQARGAVNRVAAAEKQLEGTTLVLDSNSGPFTVLGEEANVAEEKASNAFQAVSQVEEVATAFEKAEEAALAAGQAKQQARLAEELLSRFHRWFTFNSNEKALFPSSLDRVSGDRKEEFYSECVDFFVQKLFHSMPSAIQWSEYPTSPSCYSVKEEGSVSHYNCFCAYDRWEKTFYRKQ